jgi:hypothetical protein
MGLTPLAGFSSWRLSPWRWHMPEHVLSIHKEFLIREVMAVCSCGWESGWVANEQGATVVWDRHREAADA